CSSPTRRSMCASTEASFSMLAPRLVAAAARFVEEPDAPFRLVDPYLEQAGGGDIAALVAYAVGGAHRGGKALVVLAQLGQHVERRDELGVVIQHALQARDVSDRANRRAAQLAHALGDGVGKSEDLVRLLVQQQVIVAEMRPRHVPVKVLRLQVEGEDIGEQRVQRAREILCRLGTEVVTGMKQR